MNMKYISRILFTLGVVFGLTACTEDALESIGPKLPDNGEMSVNLTFALPDVTAQTRSKVSGQETVVSNMQMVCFDANGLYLGIRNATVTSQGSGAGTDEGANTTMFDRGIIKGTVPQGTSRIHFIANRALPKSLSFNVGTPEETVMISQELSTKWDDADHQKVCYWGYHKEENAELMSDWLNPEGAVGQVENSKVYLIRDRARITLTYDPAGASVPVTKIEWLIHNGLERGYLAPAKSSWTNTGYYANSTVEGHTDELVSNAAMNVYEGSRYSLWTSATVNDSILNKFDTTYDAANGGNLKVSQFLFDDSNDEIDNLKAILRVTYTVDGNPKVVYHVLKLNRVTDAVNNIRELYDIVRTNTYYINAKLLSPDVACYTSLEAAINGSEFMNAEMEVARSIAEISNKTYTLQIKLPTETTSIVLNTVGENNDMKFVFRLANDVSTAGSTNPDDFEVKWEKSQTFCDSNLPVTYNPTTKQFVIKATVLEGHLTQNLQSEWIVVKHKATGLTRYIHVFVIDQFRYKLYPKLTRVGTGDYGDCLLTFTLPPMEHTLSPEDDGYTSELVYPQELYPIDVKFTTNTLKAYGTTQGTTNYGLFGVAIEGTSHLTSAANFETGYNSPVSSTNNSNRTNWYYQQADNYWDFWYTYSLKTCPTGGVVNIYLKDVRQNIQYATVGDVGLFLYVEYFGKNYSIPLSAN